MPFGPAKYSFDKGLGASVSVFVLSINSSSMSTTYADVVAASCLGLGQTICGCANVSNTSIWLVG